MALIYFGLYYLVIALLTLFIKGGSEISTSIDITSIYVLASIASIAPVFYFPKYMGKKIRQAELQGRECLSEQEDMEINETVNKIKWLNCFFAVVSIINISGITL